MQNAEKSSYASIFSSGVSRSDDGAMLLRTNPGWVSRHSSTQRDTVSMNKSTPSGEGACGVFVVLGLFMTRSWRCCGIEAWRVVVVWVMVVVRVKVRWLDLSGS